MVVQHPQAAHAAGAPDGELARVDVLGGAEGDRGRARVPARPPHHPRGLKGGQAGPRGQAC